MTLKELTEWIIKDGGSLNTEIRLRDEESFTEWGLKQRDLERVAAADIVYIEV